MIRCANAACTTGSVHHATPNRIAPVSSTEKNPYALRTITSTPSSSTPQTTSTAPVCPAPTSAANPSPSSDGAT